VATVAPPQTKTWSDPDSLISTGHTPLIVAGWMVQLLRYQFGDERNIENSSLKDNIWTPSIDTTKILIEWVQHAKPDEIEHRPALLVKDGAARPLNIGIGNGRVGLMSGLTFGDELYGTPVTGTNTVFAIGREPGEASLLATEARRYLMQFAPKIRSDLSLTRFLWSGTGRVASIEESTQNYAIPVNFDFGYWETHRLTPESPVLKTLSIDPGAAG